ncbi:phosphatase PAP2 family protein [Niveispirillum irakense]|uniref:phosphatase PAP2 family protein n=1 Tax=Niveispirillum irakense TaxID=34011 RepID=UPI001FDF8D4C|nr:phosphatase PAP2 family protein [Niveispirillum irakense]
MRRTAPSYVPKALIDVAGHDTGTGVDRMLVVIGRSIILISFIFMIFPVIDLAVSRWFAEGQVFVLVHQPVLKGLREFGLKSPAYIISAMLLLIGMSILLPQRYRLCEPHKPLFVLLSFAAGPLLIVETLKPLIGRARPRQLLEFGGSADFTPVWQFAGACARNCSFPSGEASGAAAALSLLVLVPTRLRRKAAFILIPLLMLIALNRVLFGAHFLSDVTLAWLFTMLAMAWIWKWMEAHSNRIDQFLTRKRI